MRTTVRARARLCARMRVCACVRVCVCVFACACVCTRARVVVGAHAAVLTALPRHARTHAGLLLPGGHAPGMKQYLGSRLLQRKVAEFWRLERPVGAICHGRRRGAACHPVCDPRRCWVLRRRRRRWRTCFDAAVVYAHVRWRCMHAHVRRACRRAAARAHKGHRLGQVGALRRDAHVPPKGAPVCMCVCVSCARVRFAFARVRVA